MLWLRMSLRDLALYCSDVTLLTQQTVTPRVRSGPSGSCLVRLQPHRRAGLLYPTIYGRSDPHVSMTVRIYVRLQRLKIWCRCKEFASRRRLFLINIGTACSLYTLGDLLQQKIERQKRIDWKRTVRMATMGLACLGPLNHNWYIFLDKMLPGTTVRIVTKKVLVDMLVMGPIFLVSFYSGMCLLEGKGKSDIVAELQAKFWPTYKVDWLIWPAAQAINFFFVPTRFRVAYVNVITLIWTIFLSYMKHKEVLRPAR